MSSVLGKRKRMYTGNRFNKRPKYNSQPGYRRSTYTSGFGNSRRYFGVSKRALAPTMMNDKVFKYRRSFSSATQTFASGAPTLLAFSFQLNQVAGAADFVNMYDFYRITKVKLSYFPDQTDLISTGNTNSTDHIPLITVVDTANATAPASVNELREYNNHKIRSIIRPFKETFNVRFTDATSAERQGWIATTNATAQHFGYKMACAQTNSAVTNFTANLDWTVYIECKDPK